MSAFGPLTIGALFRIGRTEYPKRLIINICATAFFDLLIEIGPEVQCDDLPCPDQECVGEDGKPLPDGTSLTVLGSACECVAGQLVCETPPGSCEVRGHFYENGDATPSDDACNTCTCEDGALTACTERACDIVPIEACTGDEDLPDFEHDDVAIDDGLLSIDVTYSGGCETHVFELCYDPVEPGNTPSTTLHLTHFDNDDPCDGIMMETRVFDLYPLAEAGYPEVFIQLGMHRLLYIAD